MAKPECKHFDKVFTPLESGGVITVCMECEKRISGKDIEEQELKEVIGSLKHIRSVDRRRKGKS